MVSYSPSPIMVFLILFGPLFLTTIAVSYVNFVVLKRSPTLSQKMIVGAMGALFPAMLFSFGSTITGIEVTTFARFLAMIVMMALWGATFGAVLTHLIAKRLPIEKPVDPATFE
jgi:hypothetical protein